MYQDYKDLLSAFHAHGVKYLVVGGFAVIYHSQPRFTKDMDLFIVEHYQEDTEDFHTALDRLADPQLALTSSQLRKNLGLDG